MTNKNFHVAALILLLLVILSVFILWQFDIKGLTTSFFGSSSDPADINNDGLVNDADRDKFLVLYERQDFLADINGDGQVNAIDATEYIRMWHQASQ